MQWKKLRGFACLPARQASRYNCTSFGWTRDDFVSCESRERPMEKERPVRRSERFLTIYSAVLTAIFVVTTLSSFAAANKNKFDEIDVQRINVVEPDGTLRLVISNKTSAPGLIVKGKEYPHPDRKTAGVFFFDDEGTENGGLIFGGMKGKDGKVESWGHLSFDQYMQDQVFTIDAGEEDGKRMSTLQVWDRPDYPMTELLDEQQRISKMSKADQDAAYQKFFARPNHQAHARVALGRTSDRSVVLLLKDTEGRNRIVLQVAADGSPALKFLDEKGQIVSQLPEPKKN